MLNICQTQKLYWFYRLPAKLSEVSLPAASVSSQVNNAKGSPIILSTNTYRAGVILDKDNQIFDGNGSGISGVVKNKGVRLIRGDNVTV